MEKNILGEMPLRTWRWLGVNELKTAAQIVEQFIDVPDGATKTLEAVNLDSEDAARRLKITVGQGARLELILADAGRGNYSSDVEIDLRGDDSSANLEAVYFGDGERKLDLNYVIRQRGERTSAVMNVRGALSGKCNKIFRGTLDFKRGAKGATGRELEEVIILSDGTRNRSVPLMLAEEDAVDGHHAVSVGRLDEEKIFYLMSRGLDKAAAERLIVEAAFNPVIEKISDAELRDALTTELQRRLGSE